jgi:hypothetical protein
MSYSEEIVQTVWEKAKVIDANDSKMWRKDECGAWIQRMMYGDRSSQYGWEIDHIDPRGPDDSTNLCPLQWQNSIGKSDGRLICRMQSCGLDNAAIGNQTQTKEAFEENTGKVGLDRRQ